MKVVIASIKSYLRSQGIYNVNVLLPADQAGEWSWRDQKTWPGVCESGASQSPIDIDTGRSEEVSFMNLRFVFKAAKDAVVKFNGHENEVYGDFGKFIHKLEVGNRNCLSYKLKFKFPSEHAFLGVQNDGDLQIYCMSSDGSYGIVTFFLRKDLEDRADTNGFIDTLKLEKWGFDEESANNGGIPIGITGTEKKISTPKSSDELFSIDGPNLNLLITNTNDKGTLFSFKDIFRRSFAWYTGSMTTPPCKEGVQHFVMEQVIFVPKMQFATLQEKSYPSEIETHGNARKYRPQGTRKVYTHTDYGKKCAEEPAVPFTDDPKIEVKPPGSSVIDLSKIKPIYLRASTITTTYGVKLNVILVHWNGFTTARFSLKGRRSRKAINYY